MEEKPQKEKDLIKNKIISSMCLTFRHDFGLEKNGNWIWQRIIYIWNNFRRKKEN
jgi:hypothetical protein